MTDLIANARMYAVTPAVEGLWRGLLERVAEDAGVRLDYVAYPAPQPLEPLWRRPDLGAVFMCGYPIALKLADVVPLAAPVPAAGWADGRAVYRSDLIVREDAPFRTLEDTFAGTLGWTVAHSHSGFNALRHHLLRYRTAERPGLFARVAGNFVTARKVLDSVRDGSIDIGPLDGYWHMLIRRHAPELVAGIRVLESTATAPMPAFVAHRDIDPGMAEALRASLAGASGRPWFGHFAEQLLIERFEPVTQATYAATLALEQQALASGYPEPA